MLFNKPVTPLDYFYRDIVLAFLYLFTGIALPLAAMFLALELFRDSATGYALYIVFVPAFGGIAVVYFFFHKRKKTPEEKTLKQKLTERLAAGEALVTETTATLTLEDIDQIKRLKLWHTLALIPAMFAAWYLVYQATLLYSSYPLNLWISAGTGVFFAFLIYKYGQLLDKVIEKGEKNIVRGIITNKYYAGKRGFNIVVGMLPFRLVRYPYLAYNIGDEVELEVLKTFGNWTLKRRTISSAN